MATQTIKKHKEKQKKAVQFLIGNKEFISPVKPTVFSADKPTVFVSGHKPVKVVQQGSYAKPFVMPDFFLQQAEDMGKFLDKNPIPERD